MENNSKIQWIGVYEPLLMILYWVKNGLKPQFLHFLLMGSRYSAKTWHIMVLIILIFLLPKARVQINIIRKTDKASQKKTRELFGLLAKFGYTPMDFEYRKGEKILTNGYNQIMFDCLNDEKYPPSEGAKLEVPIMFGVKYIINFYEEANEINQTLIDQYTLSCRGERDVEVISLYAANPYQKNNWYTKLFNKHLKESFTTMLEKGYQYLECPEYENGNGAIFLRTNVDINPFIPKSVMNKLDALKEINYERWKIIRVGICGDIGDMIYTASLRKVERTPDSVNINYGYLVGGFDYGWGTGANASLSYGCVGFYSNDLGVDIIDEIVHSNQEEVVWDLTTTIHKLIEFYDKYRRLYNRPVRVYIDNAHNYKFYQQFNNELYKYGLTTLDIEFLPAEKPPIEQRIQITNYAMETGKIRITNDCKQLIDDFNSCRYVEVKTPKEGMKVERTHENTHSINGFEYMLSGRWNEMANRNIYYFDKQLIDE